MNEAVWYFDWGTIRGEISALGGMLGPVWFSNVNGKTVQPFAVAPWAGDSTGKLDTLPPILRRLRGEFPCVPFGSPDTRTDLPAEWLAGIDPSTTPVDSFAHGYSANHTWHLLEQAEKSITLAIDYPPDHVVERLVRRISAEADHAITLELQIIMRQDANLPVGLHPIFALPSAARTAQLDIPSLTAVRAFPVPVDDNSKFVPNQHSHALDHFAMDDGSFADVTALPLPIGTEELLAVQLTDGKVTLACSDQGYAIDLEWDAETFPQCLLWISNRGRKQYPWSGRMNAIGIEPVAAAFDLGVVHSTNRASPLAEAGVTTSVALRADKAFATSYRISVRGAVRQA